MRAAIGAAAGAFRTFLSFDRFLKIEKTMPLTTNFKLYEINYQKIYVEKIKEIDSSENERERIESVSSYDDTRYSSDKLAARYSAG